MISVVVLQDNNMLAKLKLLLIHSKYDENFFVVCNHVKGSVCTWMYMRCLWYILYGISNINPTEITENLHKNESYTLQVNLL